MATFHPSRPSPPSLAPWCHLLRGAHGRRGVLEVKDLVAFFLYLNMFYGPVQVLSTAWENIQEAIAGPTA